MTWQPDWTVEPVPCDDPDACTPAEPTCGPCLAGRAAFLADQGGSGEWAALTDFARGSWRIEAADE